ncbi:hypothetical protein BKA66DRAFT_224765 [Pyrenochaeta sp. MPI-SDFR-AT-0127]|nr:hypothetical protein BKA66DRAFT_224765 [Pyrenochaeta sp. MPI-SDFR-AT-0127]
MDGLNRARIIKAEIEKNVSVLKQQNAKATPGGQGQENFENQLIMTLRQDQHMKWNDIADFLNQARHSRGEATNLTDAAVYSSFVRTSPRLAIAVDEIGFDPKDYMHLRHPNQYTNADGSGTVSKAGKKRVKNYDIATELQANMRKRLKLDESFDLKTVEKTEKLLDAVAKVERNFWILVADEMERATTKMYQPDELASRFHTF